MRLTWTRILLTATALMAIYTSGYVVYNGAAGTLTNEGLVAVPLYSFVATVMAGLWWKNT